VQNKRKNPTVTSGWTRKKVKKRTLGVGPQRRGGVKGGGKRKNKKGTSHTLLSNDYGEGEELTEKIVGDQSENNIRKAR